MKRRRVSAGERGAFFDFEFYHFRAVFDTYPQLIHMKHEDETIKGVLVELYAASFFQESFSDDRIQRVYENVAGFGVVLRADTVKLQYCLKQYILSSQAKIYEGLRRDLPPLTVRLYVLNNLRRNSVKKSRH